MTNNRLIDPIEYILEAIMDGSEVQKFDIINALDQWSKFKNRKPVAYALDNGDGVLYDIGRYDNPYNDRKKVVSLYRE